MPANENALHGSETSCRWLDALFELEGLGREYWQGIDPNEYVRKLREDWEIDPIPNPADPGT